MAMRYGITSIPSSERSPSTANHAGIPLLERVILALRSGSDVSSRRRLVIDGVDIDPERVPDSLEAPLTTTTDLTGHPP